MTDPQSGSAARLALGLGFAVTLILGACSPRTPTPSSNAAPGSVASIEPTAEPSGASNAAPQQDQTDTDWGRIWDSLPEGFPVYPGATPAAEAATDPVSAIFALEGPNARTVAGWMQTELERAAYGTEALNGPFEDGSFVLESVGEGGCRIEVSIAPLGSLTAISVRYGSACPSP